MLGSWSRYNLRAYSRGPEQGVFEAGMKGRRLKQGTREGKEEYQAEGHTVLILIVLGGLWRDT